MAAKTRKTQPETAPEPEPAVAHPDPADRVKAGATGFEVTLADGREWLIADWGLSPRLDELRDRIFDESIATGEVGYQDCREACWTMLRSNYDLTPAEGVALIYGADADEVVRGVLAAFYWPKSPRRSFSDWVRSSLYANGLDPAAIPPDVRHHVLSQLVDLGRAVPVDKFCGAVEAAQYLAAARARAGIEP